MIKKANNYEHIFIARPDVSPMQVDALSEHLKKVIIQHGGQVRKNDYWGLRPLAYPIRKNVRGHFMMLEIVCEPAALHEMERLMRVNEDVLRFLSMRVKKFRVRKPRVRAGANA